MIPITIPVRVNTAPRRSYFLNKFQDIEFGLRWKEMLVKLAPGKAKKLSPLEPMKCYEALLAHCSKLFPIADTLIDEWEDESDYSAAYEAWSYGVPIDVLGVDYDELHYTRSPAIALPLLYSEYGGDRIDNRVSVMRNIDSLKDVKSLAKIISRPLAEKWRDAYIRRTWAKPWDTAGLFLDYCYGNTGYQILDWTHSAISQGGGFPEWSIEEIRGNATEWAMAEPAYKQICKFQEYVNANAEKRLPILAGILTADPKIIERYSTEKRIKYLKDILK